MDPRAIRPDSPIGALPSLTCYCSRKLLALQASGRRGGGWMDPYAASLDSSKAPRSPAPDQKLKPGYSQSLESQSSDGIASSRDDGKSVCPALLYSKHTTIPIMTARQ